MRDVSKLRWKLVDYSEDKKWTEIQPWSKIRSPFGVLASLIGMRTLYGHFISKEAGSLKWPKWKWFAVFFACFALAWGPAIYLGMFAKARSTGENVDKDEAHGNKKDD